MLNTSRRKGPFPTGEKCPKLIVDLCSGDHPQNTLTRPLFTLSWSPKLTHTPIYPHYGEPKSPVIYSLYSFLAVHSRHLPKRPLLKLQPKTSIEEGNSKSDSFTEAISPLYTFWCSGSWLDPKSPSVYIHKKCRFPLHRIRSFYMGGNQMHTNTRIFR